jgi:hypothetical protein
LVSDGEFNGLQIKAGSLIFNMLTYPQHVPECGENNRLKMSQKILPFIKLILTARK